MAPTDILENEHRLIERAMRVVATVADNLKCDQHLPAELLPQIVEFMQRCVKDYHQTKEDSVLFELLEQKGVPEHGCPLAPLQSEHQQIRAVLAELADAVAAYETSNLGKERVVQSLTTLAQIYPNHLWIENFLLFPMTNKLLSADEQALLGQKLDKVDAAYGSAAHQDMVRRIEELALTAARLKPRTPSQEAVHEQSGLQRTPEPMRRTAIEFSLTEEAERLRQEPAWEHGRNAKTLIKFPDLRVVLTVIRAGQTLTEHRNAGRNYIQPLSGHIRVDALDNAVDLPVGRVVALDREVPHHIVALEDSTFWFTYEGTGLEVFMEAQKAAREASQTEAATLETFEIDAAHTSIGFSVRHMVISNVRGRFTSFSGTILYDSLDNSRSSVSVTIDVASVNTENQDRDKDLRSPNFFDTTKFPQIAFNSKRIEPQCEGYLCVSDLTMHGVTKEISIPFNILGRQKDTWGNERLGFEGELKLDRRDFGLTYDNTLDNSGLVVGNEVKIELNVEAVRK